MAGRIEERDLGELLLAFGMRERNGVGADVLSDPASFTGGDIGLADDVEQTGLAVVNVAHDGHDRCARSQILDFVFDIQLDYFSGSMDNTAAALALFNLEAEAVLRADALGDRLVNRLVDVRKDAGFHQVGDDLERLLLELVSQFADDDGRFYGNHLRIRGQ